eukprot:CCRYP_020644-RA/>CCRYP_020644-RA protein AED:0.00 eAED:0.00 QI:148/1/1/1/1/1/2/108/699
MRRPRLHLIALLWCCTINHTPIHSFSWRRMSTIRSSRVYGGAECRTSSLLAAIYGATVLPIHNSISFGRCVYDISCASRSCDYGNIMRKNNLALFASKNGRDEGTTKKAARQLRKRNSISTFSTAVCIVPPDDAWDTIQRARHLARDTSFYKVTMHINYHLLFLSSFSHLEILVPFMKFKWPPAIRLFHPFAPKTEIPSIVGKLAEWIDEEGLKFDLSSNVDNSTLFLRPFEVTLDSIQILPHWEVLDARIDALEDRMSQQTVGETWEEKEYRKRKESGRMLIDQEEKKGIKRKQEREKKQLVEIRRKLKRELKECAKEKEMGNSAANIEEIRNKLKEVQEKINQAQSLKSTTISDEVYEEDGASDESKHSSFNGPCVIYLSPNQQSCIALETLREKLRKELFPAYDAFSPSSSVSPYPEHLPRKSFSDSRMGFRPLLPIARFPSVEAAVKVAKLLQKAWDPLSFNVTDIQFISRTDDDYTIHNGDTCARAAGSEQMNHATQNMAVTTSGEVEDVSKQRVFGCDAMVMLLGEEPEEELIEEDASLSMMLPEEETENHGIDSSNFELSSEWQGKSIDYDKLFSTAEREYQRMRSHEELSSATFVGSVPIFSNDLDIETWLDSDEGEMDGEGATVIVGRAQFFVGAMREFVGMPASSVIDHKERIMGGGVNSVARRKGSVHRKSESWDPGDYGRKDQDLRS